MEDSSFEGKEGNWRILDSRRGRDLPTRGHNRRSPVCKGRPLGPTGLPGPPKIHAGGTTPSFNPKQPYGFPWEKPNPGSMPSARGWSPSSGFVGEACRKGRKPGGEEAVTPGSSRLGALRGVRRGPGRRSGCLREGVCFTSLRSAGSPVRFHGERVRPTAPPSFRPGEDRDLFFLDVVLDVVPFIFFLSFSFHVQPHFSSNMSSSGGDPTRTWPRPSTGRRVRRKGFGPDTNSRKLKGTCVSLWSAQGGLGSLGPIWV